MGRLIGLTRVHTFVAVGTANVIVCFLYASFSDRIRRWVSTHELTMLEKIAGLLAVVVVFFALFKWLGSLGSKPVKAHATQPPAP